VAEPSLESREGAARWSVLLSPAEPVHDAQPRPRSAVAGVRAAVLSAAHRGSRVCRVSAAGQAGHSQRRSTARPPSLSLSVSSALTDSPLCRAAQRHRVAVEPRQHCDVRKFRRVSERNWLYTVLGVGGCSRRHGTNCIRCVRGGVSAERRVGYADVYCS
jgi:hypothetical protein